ncbi:MAG: class I SAM-dependent methyltransferase [Planctomycetota bacterium]|jgi:2-polyprenyl-3-methyl-5-hydroxy-6-metoxy-1,4-benzoquinol methylase
MANKTKQYNWDKFKTQDNQYSFPYHHIPHFDNGGFGVRFRMLHWGFEYLCYLSHTREVVRSLAPSSVLDVGCGDGHFIGMLDWGVERRVGVDLSKRAVRFAKAFYHDAEFLAVDAKELEETFDVVSTVAVLEHIPDDECSVFLKSLEERTNNNGHIVIIVPTPTIPLSKKHYRHYDLSLLQRQLKQACVCSEIINVEYVYEKSWFIELYLRLTHNRYWFIELRVLSRLIWSYVWKRLRKTDEKHGQYLVVVLRKTQPE